jgi:hypothetical protein
VLGLAYWLGDRLWGFALWLSRRKFARTLRHLTLSVLPFGRWRSGAKNLIYRQNRLALKIGRPLMRAVAFLLLLSVSLTLILLVIFYLMDIGWIPYPNGVFRKFEDFSV